MKKFLTILPLSLLLLSYNNINNWADADELDDDRPTPMEQSESVLDRSLVQRIRQEIMKDNELSVVAKNIKVVVIDGKVTLRGEVESQDEKINIAEKVRKINGVKSVDNRLAVDSDD